MTRVVWDDTSKRLYETGVQQGVLYKQANGIYPLGVPWNGLSGVSESPSGAEPNKVYANNSVYLNLLSAEEFGATIEAYTYPDEFAECDGSKAIATGVKAGQQTRSAFGLAYKTLLGNDVSDIDYGYKLHLVYGAKAAPSEKAYATINESPEAIVFSWEVSTTPVACTGFKPTASLEIDSTKVDSAKLATLEDILYGTAGADARLPLPDEVASVMTEAAPSALALSSIVPADDATAIARAADIVMTFNNEIAKEEIVVTKADGTIVPGTKTWDTPGKILTFNPTAATLDATSMYIVAIVGVVDVYGQTLAASIKNFTTGS